MARLISPDSVAEAVVAVARAGGHRSITARALAAELHVSLGALYNYTASMSSALLDADRLVYTRLLATIQSARNDEQIREGLQAAARELRLILDPRREHAPVPDELLEAFATITALPMRDQATAEVLRSYAGLGRFEFISRADLSERLDVFLSAVARSEQADPGTDHRPLEVGALRQACRTVIATSDNQPVHGDLPHLPADFRNATVDMLLENEPGSWSFRRLQELTGVPLARLNRTASRRQHLAVANHDLLTGVRAALRKQHPGWDHDQVRKRVPRTMCELPHTFIEIQSDILDVSIFAAALTGRPASEVEEANALLIYAVCHAAWRNRNRDPETWTNAAQVAGEILDHLNPPAADLLSEPLQTSTISDHEHSG